MKESPPPLPELGLCRRERRGVASRKVSQGLEAILYRCTRPSAASKPPSIVVVH